MNNFSYSWNVLAAYLSTVASLNFEMQKQVLVLGNRIGENDVINYIIYIPYAYKEVILEDQTEKGLGFGYYVEGGIYFGGKLIRSTTILTFDCISLLDVWFI
jgi:hypothetical protein